jgi:pimeloyl-ACP methyl ester carboxylesterase
MTTQFLQASDGTRIAYDQQGTGPALILIHGAAQNRQTWQQAGFVGRLQSQFTVITLDLRGHGESDAPVIPDAYTMEKIQGDIRAIANACGFKTYRVWGFSLGGNIALHLAAHEESVQRAVVAGGSFGPLSPNAKAEFLRMEAALQAKKSGQLDKLPIPPEQRRLIDALDPDVMLAMLHALLERPGVLPADLRCPTRFFIGSADDRAVSSFREQVTPPYPANLEVQMLEGLDHAQVFSRIDLLLPSAETFLHHETVRT